VKLRATNTRPVALQRCEQFVARTENWIYDHLRFLRRYRPVVLCDVLRNRAEFGAVAAWDVSTGSPANVVAVIDTGMDYGHQDLAANVWSAPSSFTVTIGGSTITCAAGTHGFNAILRTCDPMDDNNHGTHTSGTIGANGNNSIGVVGVNWTASIMAIKFLSSGGSGSTSDAINAIEFAIQAKKAFSVSNGVGRIPLGPGFEPVVDYPFEDRDVYRATAQFVVEEPLIARQSEFDKAFTTGIEEILTRKKTSKEAMDDLAKIANDLAK